MKVYITLFLLVASLSIARAQEEKTVLINDLRSMGMKKYERLERNGHAGEVVVNRTYTILKSKPKAKADSVQGYDFLFYKNHKGKVKGYQLGLVINDDYNKATYEWITDSVVVVTLTDSVTLKNRVMFFSVAGNGDAAFSYINDGNYKNQDIKKPCKFVKYGITKGEVFRFCMAPTAVNVLRTDTNPDGSKLKMEEWVYDYVTENNNQRVIFRDGKVDQVIADGKRYEQLIVAMKHKAFPAAKLRFEIEKMNKVACK